jgi:hypothetical protein
VFAFVLPDNNNDNNNNDNNNNDNNNNNNSNNNYNNITLNTEPLLRGAGPPALLPRPRLL